MSLSRIVMPLLSAHSNQAPWAQNMDKPRAVSVKSAINKLIEKGHSVDYEEVQHILQQQFPKLRELVTQWFPNKTLPQLREVDFGKTEMPLSEVHYVKKLMTLGDSVCRLCIGGQVMGTGFVLTHGFILTSAHLFKQNMFEQVSDSNLSVTVVAQFNYEDPTLTQLPQCFEVHRFILDIDHVMDYAVLWLKVQSDQSVPPGLLKHFGPCPKSGDLCIIGHPGGGVKKIDLTSVIEKEKRVESANQKLQPHDDSSKLAIIRQAHEQGIDQIMTSDHMITYDTFMFHGASGSPLFDAQGRVVGLHSAGFVYGLNGSQDKSVIEFAHPILDIFKKLLERFYCPSFKEEAQANQYVESILLAAGYYKG